MVSKKNSWFIGERISGSSMMPITDNAGNLIAVVYKPEEHGDLLAAAPDLYEALAEIRSQLPGLWGDYVRGGKITINLDVEIIENILAALSRTERGHFKAKGAIPYVSSREDKC